MASALPNILDQVALIAGGSTTGADPGSYTGAGGISGVNRAWSRVPSAISNPPELVVFPRYGKYKNPHEEKFKMVEWHEFFMRLYVMSGSGPTLEQAVNDLLPFIGRFETAYMAKVTLNSATPEFWIDSYHMGSMPFAGVNWIGIEWSCFAVETDLTSIYTP